MNHERLLAEFPPAAVVDPSHDEVSRPAFPDPTERRVASESPIP